MKVTLEIPDDLYRAIKVRAAEEDRKVKDWVAEALLERLAQPTGAGTQPPEARSMLEAQVPYFASRMSRALPHLSTEERRRRALAAIGIASSGLPDIAQNHDDYLAEAYLS